MNAFNIFVERDLTIILYNLLLIYIHSNFCISMTEEPTLKDQKQGNYDRLTARIQSLHSNFSVTLNLECRKIKGSKDLAFTLVIAVVLN